MPEHVVYATGEIDSSSIDEFEGQLLRCSPRGDVIIDFSQVRFCDSSAVRAIIRAYRRHRRSGGSVRLRDVRPNVRRVFEITELVDVLFEKASPAA
jgi:anti-anti-sigma factor